MKKKLVIGALTLGATAVVGLTGCGTSFTATFDSDPTRTEDNVVVKFKEGATKLDQIPTPVEKDGFAGVWEDFSIKNENFTVNAKYGDGSQSNPYMVATASQFRNILVNYTSATKPDNRTEQTYFKLISNIDLNEITDLQSLEIGGKYFKGVIDGSGYSLLNLNGTGLDQTEGALFANVIDSTFKNLNVYLGQNIASLAGNIVGGTVDFHNVKIYNMNGLNSTFITSNDTNESVFCFNAIGVGTKVNFTNCENYANFVSASAYNGIFMGGYATADVDEITFTNCFNYGNVTSAGTYGVLFGNASHRPTAVVISNCKNEGVITTKDNTGSFLVAKTGKDNYGKWEDLVPDNSVSYVKYFNTIQNGYIKEGVNATFKALEEKNYAELEDANVNICSTEGNLAAGKYQLILSGYARRTDGSTLFTNIVLNNQVSEGNSTTFENAYYGMIDLNKYNDILHNESECKHEDEECEQYKILSGDPSKEWTKIDGYNIKYFKDDDRKLYVIDYSQYESDMGVSSYTINMPANKLKKIVVVDTGDKVDFVVDEFITKINVSNIEELKSALTNNIEKDVIALNADLDLKDVNENKALEILSGKNTLDLNGHKITGVDNGKDSWHAINLKGETTELTIIDSSEGKTGTIEGRCYGIQVSRGAKLTINGGNFVCTTNGTFNQSVVVYGGELVVNGGVFTSKVYETIFGQSYTWDKFYENNITINGGEFNYVGEEDLEYGLLYFDGGDQTVTINGGVFNNNEIKFVVSYNSETELINNAEIDENLIDAWENE